MTRDPDVTELLDESAELNDLKMPNLDETNTKLMKNDVPMNDSEDNQTNVVMNINNISIQPTSALTSNSTYSATLPPTPISQALGVLQSRSSARANSSAAPTSSNGITICEPIVPMSPTLNPQTQTTLQHAWFRSMTKFHDTHRAVICYRFCTSVIWFSINDPKKRFSPSVQCCRTAIVAGVLQSSSKDKCLGISHHGEDDQLTRDMSKAWIDPVCSCVSNGHQQPYTIDLVPCWKWLQEI